MAAKRISIAALCDNQPRRLPTAGDCDGPGGPSARRPSDSSSSDASGSSASAASSVAHLVNVHGSSPTRTTPAYDPIRDADNRHDDPQSTRPISSFSPATPTTLPPPSAHIRKPPLAPTQHYFTPIAPRPDPASIPVSVRNTSTLPPKPPSPPNAPSARSAHAQQHTRHLAIPPTPRYTPYPPQPSKQTLAYSTQFSPSSRTDLRSNNGPIAFEFWDPNNAAGSSSSRRSSKSKANRTSPSSSSVGKPGSGSTTNMSAPTKKSKSKSKSKPAVVGQEEASNTSPAGLLGSNARGEVNPNTVASCTSPSAGCQPPTPGAASNGNSSPIDDALDIEMELLNALGGDEETHAGPASLGARGPPAKPDPQPTTADDDLLEEVEAMERVAAHKSARQTPSMSSPMKHEPEEGDAMEIDLKRSTLSPSPAIFQPLQGQPPSRTSPNIAPTPIPISASQSQPTSASQSLRPTPSPARTPTTAPANLPAPLPPGPSATNAKKGPLKSTGGAAKASAATSKSRPAKPTAAKKKQSHPNANELLKVSNTKPKGGGGPSSSSGPGTSSTGSFAFHGTSSGRAAAAAASASFGAALSADDGYEDQRDGTEYRPDASATAKGPGGGEDESEDEVDLRLYCLCRQLYDDRFMLGCENCDDWFHPNCIGLEEYQCDLLEHFYCEACQRADPNLKIVWRHRCANGLRHPVPGSSDACWRASHPPMSKYCSKECGIEAMERRLLPYTKQKAGLRFEADERDEGVKREMKRLFMGVRERKRREAVVLRVDDGTGADVGADAEVKREPGATDGIADASNRGKGLVIPPGMVVLSPKSRLTSDLAALQHDLRETLCELQMRTRELSFILARAGLVKLAVSWSDKPENVQKCCFDSRMLMDGEDWEEWVEGEGRSVLEGVMMDGPGGSAPLPMLASSQSRHTTTTNGREARPEQETQTTPPEGEESGLEDEMGVEDEDSPWCDGRRKCERHAGWQKLQVAECDLNRGIKDLIISRLKDRAEHLRIRIKCAVDSAQLERKKDSESVMLDVV